MVDGKRVALLVDGDNVSADHAKQILNLARSKGVLHACRVYCDVTRHPKWSAVPEFNVLDAGSGKNASDLLLAIDAMEFCAAATIDCFVLVSSDADFAHLAHRLSELGHRVIGAGEAKTPKRFRLACHDWHALPWVETPTELDRKVRELIDEYRTENSKNPTKSIFGTLMWQRKRTRRSDIDESSWTTYLNNRKHLYELRECDGETTVWYHAAAFAN